MRSGNKLKVQARLAIEWGLAEALQKRALRIILHPVTLPYNTALALCEIESLKLGRCNFQQKFYKLICHPGNCLHDLLQPQRDPSVSDRLGHCTVYPIPQKSEQNGTTPCPRPWRKDKLISEMTVVICSGSNTPSCCSSQFWYQSTYNCIVGHWKVTL